MLLIQPTASLRRKRQEKRRRKERQNYFEKPITCEGPRPDILRSIWFRSSESTGAKIGRFLGRQGRGNWGRVAGGDRDRLGGRDGAIDTHLLEKKGCNTDNNIRPRKKVRKLGCFRLSAVLPWHFVGSPHDLCSLVRIDRSITCSR